MQLNQLIQRLEQEPRDRVITLGFHHPHSYRGYYECVAFEPKNDVSIGEMLDAARSALGSTYIGWKGGEFVMREYTDCYLAHEGSCGEEIGRVFLNLLLRQEAQP